MTDPFAPPAGRNADWAFAADSFGDLTVATPNSPQRGRLAVAMVAIAVVVVLVGGVTAVSALTGRDRNTPQDAVKGLITAAGNADVLGVLGALDPAERGALTSFVTATTADLRRLGVLSPASDLHRVSGLALSIDHLTTTTTQLRPGLAAVTITGGTLHGHVDAARLPLGPLVHELASGALAHTTPHDTTETLHVSAPIVTIRRGATWYVSVGYTIAEAARKASHAPLPAVADSVPAIGFASPVAAVDAFLRASANLDVRSLVAMTPPEEMGALHDYAPLFLPRVDEAIAKAEKGNIPTISITTLSLAAEPHAGGVLVKVERIGVRATFDGMTLSLDPGARCITASGDVSGLPAGVPGLCGAVPGGPTSSGPDQALATSLAAPLKQLSGIRPDVGIETVAEGGKWYVSPVRTLLDDVEAVLHAVTPEMIKAVVKAFDPAPLLGLGFAGYRAGRATAVGGGQLMTDGGASNGPTFGPCVNGTRTVTFPPISGRPPLPPFTISC